MKTLKDALLKLIVAFVITILFPFALASILLVATGFAVIVFMLIIKFVLFDLD